MPKGNKWLQNVSRRGRDGAVIIGKAGVECKIVVTIDCKVNPYSPLAEAAFLKGCLFKGSPPIVVLGVPKKYPPIPNFRGEAGGHYNHCFVNSFFVFH